VRTDLDRLNALGIWDFTVAKSDQGTLLILGSNDFTYSHRVEIEFSGVSFHDLPETFSHAEFLLSPSVADTEDGEPRNVYVFGESLIDMRTEYRIRARGVAVRMVSPPSSGSRTRR
jgi:hypothetical protein